MPFLKPPGGKFANFLRERYSPTKGAKGTGPPAPPTGGSDVRKPEKNATVITVKENAMLTRLKERRLEEKFTIRQLAALIGLRPEELNEIELGLSPASPETWEKLERILDADRKTLMEENIDTKLDFSDFFIFSKSFEDKIVIATGPEDTSFIGKFVGMELPYVLLKDVFSCSPRISNIYFDSVVIKIISLITANKEEENNYQMMLLAPKIT
jgi:transcriptional regulator with XRE-family HTH domain